MSYNARKGTLRGLHYQAAPHEEHKLVRCTAGAIFDVIVDVRPDSRGYRRWFGTELTAQNRRALFIPPGFAHGFITLSDAAEVYYMISVPHAPAHAQGFRWSDPAFGIQWPLAPSCDLAARCRLSVAGRAGEAVILPKRVLVTGAGGFIGRWSVAPLLDKGFEVHAVLSGIARQQCPRGASRRIRAFRRFAE